MNIKGSVVFVTGANRGLGLEFAKLALTRGAAKVYAAARDPSTVTMPGVIPVKLDVTKPEDVAEAVKRCGDVTFVVNNAGIGRFSSFLAEDSRTQLRDHLETNLFGVLNVSQGFAGTLGRNGGGTLLNILSIVSWVNQSVIGAYCVSKSAAWSLTNGLRHELSAQKTQVVGLHVGYIDTDMTRDFDAPKTPPAEVARIAFDAVEAGEVEVSVDEPTREVKKGLSSGIYLQDIFAE